MTKNDVVAAGQAASIVLVPLALAVISFGGVYWWCESNSIDTQQGYPVIAMLSLLGAYYSGVGMGMLVRSLKDISP